MADPVSRVSRVLMRGPLAPFAEEYGGELLRSAGVVRGMELDINPAWVSGVYFHPNGRPHPPAFELFPDQQIGTQHYLQISSRDFFSFDLRSAPDTAGAAHPTPLPPPHR